MQIADASRKFLDREVKCLTIEWVVQKFHVYLYGKDFILETDQKPLSYLSNIRKEQWKTNALGVGTAMLFFSIDNIRGKDNVEADLLSRCPV